MRVSRLAPILAIAALALCGPAAAQTVAQQMLESAAKMRANVERLKDTLPPDVRAQMLRQADDIERQVREGAFGDAVLPPKEPPLAERIAAAHGGQLEWLTATGACGGYTQDNYLTWRHSAPDRTELDQHCKNAYGHWAGYVRWSRDANGAEGAEQALFYYDAAARRAVGYRK